MSGRLRGLLHRTVSADRRAALARRLRRLRRPARLGTLRRLHPLSDDWGFDRGTPIDRYYIERFLASHRGDIRGRVLEVKDSTYTRRYGSAVERADVLDIDASNRSATFVADLATAPDLPSDAFDCFILTQTLQLIGNVEGAVTESCRLLRPGGILLATVPSLSRIPRSHRDTDSWRFTPVGCRRLFGSVFGPEAVEVHTFGNVLAGIAFLAGLAREELRPTELDAEDPLFPVLVAVRAVKQ